MSFPNVPTNIQPTIVNFHTDHSRNKPCVIVLISIYTQYTAKDRLSWPRQNAAHGVPRDTGELYSVGGGS